MRVALIVRPSAGERSGGDITQARFTRRGLEAAGVTAEILPALEPDVRGYDLAHVFGVFDPEICTVQMGACRRAGIPLALSPIWWDLYDFFGRSRACERILAGPARHVERRLERLRRTETKKLFRARETRRYAARLAAQRALMREADVLLPNSAIEAHFYVHQLQLYDRPFAIVHNPVDVPTQRNGATRSGVACVARIEQKKNQAMLLYALAGLDVDVLLIGGSHEPAYLDLCRRWTTPRTRLAGNLTHDEVLATLATIAVHVLPSWAETPGIANLEAAAAGARVVVSSDGTECEYFGEHVEYVDPADPAAIRKAVVRQLSLPPRDFDDALTMRLRAYNADVVGKRTLEGYRIALQRRVSGSGC
jgi:glycosyltransferase involved in cell wall biosynthesis